MLIPSYFLIKLWGGGAERHYAALKFVLYTLLGSVFMLVGIALLDINYHQWASLRHMDQPYSFDLLELLSVPIPLHQQMLIFWLMFIGFAFKAPVFPFHTWLPDALLEGPIGMAVVLAGIKLGTFGFMRFSIPLLPEASKSATVVSVMMGLGTGGDRVWRDHGADSAGLSPSPGLQQHQPPGFHRDRPVRAELPGPSGQPAHHDQSRDSVPPDCSLSRASSRAGSRPRN